MMVKQIPTVGLGVLLTVAATAIPAEAQMRRWAGIGMAAAGGVVAALTPTRCRVSGELSNESAFGIVFSNTVGDVGVLFDNARSPVAERVGGRCDLDWRVDGSAGAFLFGRLVQVESLGSKKASEFRGDYPFVDDTRGAARAESYKPRGQLLAGLGLAGAGAVLALLPGGDQVRPSIDLRRRSVGVSRTVGW